MGHILGMSLEKEYVGDYFYFLFENSRVISYSLVMTFPPPFFIVLYLYNLETSDFWEFFLLPQFMSIKC